MKRIICLVLAVLLLTGTLVSCGGNNGGKPAETDKKPAETQNDEVRVLSDLPEGLSFNGADFTVAARGTACSVDYEEISGDGVEDSVYKRNRKAEDVLKVKISAILSEENNLDEMVTAIKAGENTYAAAMTHITKMMDLTQQGYFYNVDMVPHLDLDKPYWTKSVTDSLKIGDKSYLFSGDISIVDNTSLWSIFFNKEMRENLGLKNYYDEMAEGRWTFDLFAKDTAAAANDLNGDGQWDWSVDQFGFVNLTDPLCGFYGSMGQMAVTRDSDGTLAYTLGADSSVNAIMKIADWAISGSATYLLGIERITTNQWSDLTNVFTTGRALFMGRPIGVVYQLRDMEQQFGILPMPKMDESQPDYVSSVQEWGQCVYAVPVCSADPAMSGAVLEFLGGLSTDTVRKAYYDVALTRRYSRDKESSASLDILFDNVVLDLGFCYFGLRTTIAEMVESGVVSSKLQSMEKSINRQIATAEKNIAKLDH